MLQGVNSTNRKTWPQHKKEGVISLSYENMIIGLIMLFVFSWAEMFSAINILHYTIYITPLLFLSAYLLQPASRNPARRGQFLWVLLMLLSFFLPSFLSETFALKYIVFMWFGFLPLAFPVRVRKQIVIKLFWMCSIAQLFFSSINGFNFKFLNADSLSSGSGSITHTLPAMFGLLLGALFYQKKYKTFLICLVMISMAGKRSVLMSSAMGMLGMVASYVLASFFSAKRKWIGNAIIYLVLTVTTFTVAMFMPRIYEILSARAGVSEELISSGRYVGQSLAFSALHQAELSDLLFGWGLGQADAFAYRAWQGITDVIHSDYLRFIIDFGAISGALYILCYARLLGAGALGAYLVCYSEYSWISENNVINIMLDVIMIIIVFSLADVDREDPQKRQDKKLLKNNVFSKGAA